jgi:GT2 family glycosyltransferase
MTNSPDLSIVIITRNAQKLLGSCLKSVYQNTKKSSFEVIVVENASTDGTLEMLNQFPKIQIIKNQCNRGVGPARNQGMRLAKGRYILLLDADTTVIDNALDILVEYMDDNPKVGICGPKLVGPTNELQLSCRRFPTVLTKILRRAPLSMAQHHLKEELLVDWDHNSIKEVDYIIGACQIIRKEAFQQIGYLDENIFYGPEDVDYCVRMWQKGWLVCYNPTALIMHHEQRITKKKLLSKLTLLHAKGLVYYFIKYRYIQDISKLKKPT